MKRTKSTSPRACDDDDIRKYLNLHGWIKLSSASSEEMQHIVRALGTPLPNSRTGAEFTDLIPYERASAPARSMSAIVGTGDQPMHTDGAHIHDPPRYIALFCLESGGAFCPTNIWTVDRVKLQQDWPLLLTNPSWVFHDGVHQPFYSSVVQSVGGMLKIRFDPCCMKPATSSQFTVADALNLLLQYSQQFSIEWRRNQAIIIDNWRCLHARGDGSIKAPSRRLRRWCIGD